MTQNFNGIGLIGAKNKTGQENIYGTGIIFQSEGVLYIATCRHVFYPHKDEDWFFIPKPLKSSYLLRDNYSISLGSPIFHPDDTLTCTYDTAIFTLSDIELSDFKKENIWVYSLENTTDPKILLENSPLLSIGYSTNYLYRELTKNDKQYLQPNRVLGRYVTLPLEKFQQNKMCGKVIEAFFINPIQKLEYTIDGMSGGLILKPNNGEIVGILNGDVTYEVNNVIRKQAICFISITRIIETINGN